MNFRRTIMPAGSILLASSLLNSAHAQFTTNNQTNIISGVISNWTGGYYLGSNFVFDALLIRNAGVLTGPGSAFIGYSVGANSNIAVVTGSGSSWNMATYGAPTAFHVGYSGSANSLVISNGGKVINSSGCSVGYLGSNNTALVTGPGSVWTNRAGLSIGNHGAGNTLTINNGGVTLCGEGSIGTDISASNNLVTVNGSGSLLVATQRLWVGNSGRMNRLVISDGGMVVDEQAFIGFNGNSVSNHVLITGTGSVWKNQFGFTVGYAGLGNELTISNGAAVLTGFCTVNGTLTCDGGTLSATNVTVSVYGSLRFNGGWLNSASTAVTNTQQFFVGNGTNSATFRLLGGVHSFNDGIRISINSLLTGCGTINGNVLIDAGGALHANCTNLIFNSSVTNNGTMVVDDAVLETFSTFVNNGKLYLINGGTTNFHGTLINNGQILKGDVQLTIAKDGSDGFFVRYTGLPDVTYRLQRAASVTGTWSDLATNTAPASGLIEFHDTSPLPGRAFYRAVLP